MAPATASDLDLKCPLTLVYGSAQTLRRRVLERVLAENLPGAEREWGLVNLDAQEVKAEGVAAQLTCGSLMADTRVVVIRNLEKLPASVQNAVAAALRNLSPGTLVVIDAQSETDYRKKGPPVAAELRKLLEAKGQIIEAAAPDDRELPAWVSEEAATRGKTMPPVVARAFVEAVGTQTDSTLNELEKLITYVGPERAEITAADVDEVVSGEHDATVFDLVDAIGRRDARAALAALPGLLPASGAQGAAMPILAMISRQLRLVWQARVLGAAGINLENAASLPKEWAARLPEEHNFFDATKGRRFLVRKYAEQARNFTDSQLVRALVRVYETDLALKGQGKQRMDDRLALETLIVSLCRL